MITGITVNSEKVTQELLFGHKIKISFTTSDKDKLNFGWYERADSLYEVGNPKIEPVAQNVPGKWADLYDAAKSYSPVFEDLQVEGYKEMTIECEDKPYVKLQPNKKRILDFFIVLKDEDSSYVIKAQQILETDSNGKIVAQNFEYNIVPSPKEDRPSSNDADYYEIRNF